MLPNREHRGIPQEVTMEKMSCAHCGRTIVVRRTDTRQVCVECARDEEQRRHFGEEEHRVYRV